MHPTLPIFRFPARTLPALLVHSAHRIPDAVFIRFLDPTAPGAEQTAEQLGVGHG